MSEKTSNKPSPQHSCPACHADPKMAPGRYCLRICYCGHTECPANEKRTPPDPR